MIWRDEDEDRGEQEPRELPDMRLLATPEACIVCGKNATRACMHCGNPVCINPTNYMAKSTCGDWIMDWWSNGAMDPDDGNEFWCVGCLAEEYGVDPEVWKSEKQEDRPAPAPAQAAIASIEDDEPF